MFSRSKRRKQDWQMWWKLESIELLSRSNICHERVSLVFLYFWFRFHRNHGCTRDLTSSCLICNYKLFLILLNLIFNVIICWISLFSKKTHLKKCFKWMLSHRLLCQTIFPVHWPEWTNGSWWKIWWRSVHYVLL